MIKAIVLDIDGVIVGDKPGINLPLPHPEVVKRLRIVNKDGIPICLCTGKGKYALQPVVEMIELDSVHSSDNGALIVKGVNCEVFKRHPIPSSSITSLITFLKQHLSYIELYSDEQYFLENDQESELTIKHAEILQKSPTLVEDLIDCSQKEKIIRVAAMSDDPSIISKVLSDVSNFSNVLTVTLTSHPYMYPYKIFVCTQVGISKESALYEISAHLGISPNEMLGVGDTMGDWPFIKHCGYKATVANGSDELKGLVRASGNKGFVGKSVNEHGILGILNYFEIT